LDIFALAALATGSFVLALSGALQPGPMFFATIAGVRRRGFWFGPLAILGHALVELPVVVFLVLEVSAVLTNDYVLAGIGGVGTVALTWMAAGLVRQGLRPPPETPGQPGPVAPPACRAVESGGEKAGAVRPGRALAIEAAGTGILTSILNPYWYLWWVTQPTLLLASAVAQGWPGVGAFFVGHISADLAWFVVMSYGISRGRNFLRGRVYQALLIGCAAMLLVMAGLFARLVVEKLWAAA